MKINKMPKEQIQQEIDKLKTPIDRIDGKRTKGDESPSRRFQHLSDRLYYLTMKKAFIVLAFILLGSLHGANIYIEAPKPPKKTIKARITAYWLGEDDYGYKSASGKRLISGRSCAVDPRIIPYGTILVVEGKPYVAHDTGTAVVQRKASGRSRLPVIDLFYKTEAQANRELSRVGHTAIVELQ
jgi:3D (Asp-Asp-Asp) domain-containing protein